MLFLIAIFKLGTMGNTLIKYELYLYFFQMHIEMPRTAKVTMAMTLSDIIDMLICYDGNSGSVKMCYSDVIFGLDPSLL